MTSHAVQLANAPTAPETVDEIVRLYESGLSMDATAKKVGVSAKTVFNHLRARGRQHGLRRVRESKKEGHKI